MENNRDQDEMLDEVELEVSETEIEEETILLAEGDEEAPELDDEEGEFEAADSSEALEAIESLSAESDSEYQEVTETAPSEAESETSFINFEQDPGLEDVKAEASNEGEETQAPIEYRDLSSDELQAAVEATFFMHHKPITVGRLRELINPKIAEEEYRTAVSNLMATYFEESRGIELVEVANGYQLRTKVEHKDIIRRMYQISPMKLTNAMLEVLAIAAYNQPLTRETVDRIRGVDSSHLVRVLLDKKMLRIVGKSDEIGRPMLYGTTKEFLELFGLRDLGQLPSLRELEDMLPKNEVGTISEEEALAKDMEGIVENSKPLEFNDLELEDLESNETQKVTESEPNLSALANSNRGEKSHRATKEGGEAEGDFNLPPEVARHLPLGPEGNA